MMRVLSATDVAIARAMRDSTLWLEARNGRMGHYIAISDDHGVIEIALTWKEADDRLAAIRERLG